jgi:hypothetical protein
LTALTIAPCIPSATWRVNSTEIRSNPAASILPPTREELFDVVYADCAPAAAGATAITAGASRHRQQRPAGAPIGKFSNSAAATSLFGRPSATSSATRRSVGVAT